MAQFVVGDKVKVTGSEAKLEREFKNWRGKEEERGREGFVFDGGVKGARGRVMVVTKVMKRAKALCLEYSAQAQTKFSSCTLPMSCVQPVVVHRRQDPESQGRKVEEHVNESQHRQYIPPLPTQIVDHIRGQKHKPYTVVRWANGTLAVVQEDGSHRPCVTQQAKASAAARGHDASPRASNDNRASSRKRGSSGKSSGKRQRSSSGAVSNRQPKRQRKTQKEVVGGFVIEYTTVEKKMYMRYV